MSGLVPFIGAITPGLLVSAALLGQSARSMGACSGLARQTAVVSRLSDCVLPEPLLEFAKENMEGINAYAWWGARRFESREINTATMVTVIDKQGREGTPFAAPVTAMCCAQLR
jgi:hypothetical protein